MISRRMEGQEEKVYVALGNQLQDGVKTLEWTLRKWRSQPISVVILHITHNVSVNDYVYTPLWKLPASSASDMKLKAHRKYEQEKTDHILSEYIACCGKARVKARILSVEKYDDPIHMQILDLISGLHITKLVMEFKFMKASWKPKTVISGSFHIYQHKPQSCEVFIICVGKEVFLRGENDQRMSMEDDQGALVAKVKDRVGIKYFIGNMLGTRQTPLASSTRNDSSRNTQWKDCPQEIENYLLQLSSNLDEEEYHKQENDTSHLLASPADAIMLELNENPNMTTAKKFESLKSKVREAHETLQRNKKEIQGNVARRLKAEWAIGLCDRRAHELEGQTKEEAENRTELNKKIDTGKEHLHEVTTDIEESKNKLNSLIELQSELSNKLHISKLAITRGEAQLENEVKQRAEMVRVIEQLRRERDVFQRRIELCREKDITGMAGSSNELKCCLRKYTVEQINLATNDYSEQLRLNSGCGRSTTVYKGRINHDRVAIKIKLLNVVDAQPREDFQAEVKAISHLRHPHLLAMMGYCSELNCIVYEYMHNGNLQDVLFSSPKRFMKGCRVLTWHDRIRIASEICSALCYFHQARPRPIIHGHLSPSKILLDRNLVAKIGGFGFGQWYCRESHVELDIRAFGVLTMNLLIGRNSIDEAMFSDMTSLAQSLDETAGPWPLDLVKELTGLVSRCLSVNDKLNKGLRMTTIMEELDHIRKKGDDLVARGGCGVKIGGSVQEVCNEVPSVFLCPIFQEVMKDPHVAADGFSYEREAIAEWFRMGHDTSPMTNLQLKHTVLVPNYTLRSLIQDWHCKR